MNNFLDTWGLDRLFALGYLGEPLVPKRKGVVQTDFEVFVLLAFVVVEKAVDLPSRLVTLHHHVITSSFLPTYFDGVQEVEEFDGTRVSQ